MTIGASRWSPQPLELSAITMMFRDVADKDYIAARLLFRNDLDLQFLWSALQALEKYLKGILLFNGHGTHGVGHSLTRAFDRLRKIDDVPLQFPKDLRPFLEHVEAFGHNRYLVQSHYVHGDELLQLDRAVWYIRRYCQYLRGPDAADPKYLAAALNNIHRVRWQDHPERFRLGGYLESIVQKHKSFERSALIWNNLYYGKRRRKNPPRMRIRSVSINPVHVWHPEVVQVLRNRVQFSRELLAWADEHESQERE
jgi:HEPN domain-containing protein